MKPNILFLLVDSFRSDKCYGKEKTSITPNLDWLIEKGCCFDQTISSAPVTIPGVSCIFTGQYPSKSVIRGGNRLKLNPKLPNFISLLKNSDYSTTAIIPKLLSLSGVTADFDNVIETPGHDGLYDGVGKKILEVFEEKKLHDPWFFYVHLLDVHGTARGFPEKFNEPKYGINQYERMISSMDFWFGKLFQKINFENTMVVLTADHSSDVGIYTSEMEFDKNNVNHGHMNTSPKLGSKFSSNLPNSFLPLKSRMKNFLVKRKEKIKSQKKFDKLKQINEKNLGTYEKRILQHSINPEYDVYDDRFIVPLIFSGYGINNYSIIKQQVRTIDVFPTIIDIIKIPNNIKSDGVSLLSLVEGESMKEFPAYMESIANWTKSTRTLDVIGIRYNQYKYFRSREDKQKKIGLFNLHDDPHEEYNLAQKQPDKIIEMEKILSSIILNNNNPKSESEEFRDLDEEKLVEAELKKLGYL